MITNISFLPLPATAPDGGDSLGQLCGLNKAVDF